MQDEIFLHTITTYVLSFMHSSLQHVSTVWSCSFVFLQVLLGNGVLALMKVDCFLHTIEASWVYWNIKLHQKKKNWCFSLVTLCWKVTIDATFKTVFQDNLPFIFLLEKDISFPFISVIMTWSTMWTVMFWRWSCHRHDAKTCDALLQFMFSAQVFDIAVLVYVFDWLPCWMLMALYLIWVLLCDVEPNVWKSLFRYKILNISFSGRCRNEK